MSKILNLLILLISISTLQSQNYNSYSGQFDKHYGGKYEVDLSHLKRFGYQDVFKYNAKEFDRNKDSLQILLKIKYVSIKISEHIDLEAIVRNLNKLPNLEYLKFNTPASLFKKGKVINIIFPRNIYKLKNVKTISLKGDFYWNYDNFIISISKLPKLKNLALVNNNFPNKVFQNSNFIRLKHLKGLSYSGSNKIRFPENIKDFKNLTSLSLSYDSDENSMREISKFSSLSNLKFLNLRWITLEDTIFKNFKNLKELSLSSLEIKRPTEFFLNISRIKSLERLILFNNKLVIPKEIPHLKSLKYFFSANNPIGIELPNQFYNFTNLTNIEIQGSEIETVSNSLNKLKNLKILKLYFNKIKNLPKNISGLSSLKKLYLNNNQINELPKDIGKLNLSYLSLNNNLLEILPSSIVKLTHLDTLNLKENYIFKLPKRIGDLEKLKYLNLELNNLKELPKSFKSLKKIEHLNISRNKITFLPANFGNLSSLKILNAEFCLLTKLPKSFGKLSKLERLTLTNNNLQSLSENFGNLKKLKKLYLYNRKNYNYVFKRNFKKDTTISLKVLNNNIRKLPVSFSNLPKLKFLELSLNKNIDEKQLFNILEKSKFKNYRINLKGCKITELPISNWHSIKVAKLDLRDNLISEIPKDIINAKYLNELNLNRNKGINTYRGNKAQINLLFVEKGFIQENKLKKNDELVIAYAKTANRKINNYEYKKGIEYAEKAFAINKTLTHKHLYEDDYIKALYKTKSYQKAISFANTQIKKDTSQRIRLLNSIIPNLKYKAKSQLALGDTIQAIKIFELVSKEFNSNQWSLAGVLAKKINKDSLATNYFNKSFNFYLKNLKQNKNDLGAHFSLLEAYIIANKKKDALRYYAQIENIEIKSQNYIYLKNYFNIILNINNINFDKEYNHLEETLKSKKYKLSNWSFDLLLTWNKISSNSLIKKNQILKLTSLLTISE